MKTADILSLSAKLAQRATAATLPIDAIVLHQKTSVRCVRNPGEKKLSRKRFWA